MKRLILYFLILTAALTSPVSAESFDFDLAWKKIHAQALVLDVRSREEFESGHIEGAINIPHDELVKRLAEMPKVKNKEIVVYCKSGRRAGLAKQVLEENGYSNVLNAGGYTELFANKPK